MDFRFDAAAEALRHEAQAFLQEHTPPWAASPAMSIDQRGFSQDDAFEQAVVFNRKLAERGWLGLGWPKQYGGQGASIYEQVAFNEEMGYYGAPDTGTRAFGVNMIGPTLMVHSTDEQKATYLPKITSCEHIWCQGYSEPGSGSDLASLQTRAVREGDDYVINGEKIWTSCGHRANQMFCLVRTDPDAPKHRGISFLLIDDIQNLAGLTIQPVINMANEHGFNRVFFEDVRVPARNLVGEENRGWYVGMTLLDFERSGTGKVAEQRHVLEHFAEGLRGRPAAVRTQYRAGLADLVVANNVGRSLGYRIAHIQASGGVPNYEASVSKVFQASLGQRMCVFGVALLGLHGQLLAGHPRAPYNGDYARNLLWSLPTTIYGGTNEIQRTIIATRGLGLPRD